MEVVGTPPATGEDRAALRSSVLSDWGKDPAPAPAVAQEAPEPETPAPTPPPDEAPAEGGEAPPAGDTDPSLGEDPTEPDAEQPAPPVESVDPELSKRLEAVQAAERRKMENIERRFKELEAKGAELERQWGERIRRAEAFEQLSQRAKYDPASVLSELGLTDDDFEPAARQLYSRSKAAANDPRTRAAAEQAMRERESQGAIGDLRRQMHELQRQLLERDQRETDARETATYLSHVQKALSDETPIVKQWLSKAPQRAQDELINAARRLYQEHGEVPEPAALLRELEKARRAELEELGVDVATSFKTTKQATPVAGEKRNGRTTLSAELTTTTKPRTEPQTREELREETLRALSSGEFE